MRPALLICLGLVLVVSCGGREDRVVIAAGTTIVDSGFIGRVLEVYESASGRDVSVVGGSSAEVLELLAQGAADLAISHAPALESNFLRERDSFDSAGLFASRFVMVGPPEHTSAVSGLDPSVAFRRLWDTAELVFVTRDDGSGTHATETAIWRAAGIEPTGDRYVRTGQGMGFTLQVADQRDAVTLAEIGAFLAARANLSMTPADLAASPLLDNPYVGVAGVGTPGREVRDWLRSQAGVAAIADANEALFGATIYRP